VLQLAPAAPLALQAPPSQKKPARQSAGDAQLDRQELPAQTEGAQLREAPAWQTPTPAQVLAAYSVAPSQRPWAHWVPAG
jgi:hypothetical protein